MQTPRSNRANYIFYAAATTALLLLFQGVVMAEDLPSAIKSDKSPYPTFGKLESKDPRFDKLISPDAKIEKLAEGFVWCEGPVWFKDGKFLLFSDIPRNSLMKWKDGEGMSPTHWIPKAASLSASMVTAGFQCSPKTAASERLRTITRASASIAPTIWFSSPTAICTLPIRFMDSPR